MVTSASPSPSGSPDVAAPLIVVGSINRDYFTFVRDFPRAGETILATASSEGLGGKGCNQAVASAKLGHPTFFVGAVGDDPAGAASVRELVDYGVETSNVTTLESTATGAAYIAVNDSGENTIIVHSGANALVGDSLAGRDDFEARLGTALDEAGARAVVLVQGELAASTNDRVAVLAEARGLRLVANAAPVDAVSDSVIRRSSPLVVNETEAGDLIARIGRAPEHDPVVVIGALRDHYGIDVVVTLGSAGVIAVDGDGVWNQPAPRPGSVIDTTGAGDSFVGVLAATLCSGTSLRDAVRRAVAAASHSVTARGIGSSYATAAELDALEKAAPHAH